MHKECRLIRFGFKNILFRTRGKRIDGEKGRGESGEKRIPARYVLDISGGVSFFTYLPTTPSLIVLRSLFFFDSMSRGFVDNGIENVKTENGNVTTPRRSNLSGALRVAAFDTEGFGDA